MGMANFQRIPHKERVRQAKYRHEHEEKLEDARMQRFMKELEKAKCSNEPYVSDKEREYMDELRRLGLLERGDGNA